ncbi:MAG: hypothetical protein CMP95_06535 [Gammaproteobacteria bacterium]|nr:hypothetical protein [Gammaproteobacteria bacterium]
MHFSMNFWAEFTDVMGVSLEQIGEVFENGVSFKSLRAIIYSGLLANDMENDNAVDYNLYKVGQWMDEFTSDQINDVVNTMMQSRILGNDINMGIERNTIAKDKDDQESGNDQPAG